MYHTDARAPSVTSPMTDAPGATKAPSPRAGEAPAKGCRVRWEETEEETEEVLNVDSNIIGLEVWHEIVAKQTPHPLKKG